MLNRQQWGMLIDLDRCVGCQSCVIACKQETYLTTGEELGALPDGPAFRNQVKTIGPVGIFPNLKMHYLPTQCNHCQDPDCQRVCPTSAIAKRPDGIVALYQDKCICCGACVDACPYDAFYFNPKEKVLDKCTFCVHRVEMGLDPACVQACVARAQTFGDLSDSRSEIAHKLEANRGTIFVLRPEMDTQPSVFYKLSRKNKRAQA